ncbi:uncharacterized protein LOC143907324 [Temnothorax americanus]|uniref:uncharacterized protein LOC143907324 n=1 Tax=Temnothorax americanus TaxID=1964332 RepID=UPI004068A96E
MARSKSRDRLSGDGQRSRSRRSRKRDRKSRRKSRETERHARRHARERTRSRSPIRASSRTSSCSSSHPRSPPTNQVLEKIFEKLAQQEERLTSIEVRTTVSTEPDAAQSSATDPSGEGETVLSNRGREPGSPEVTQDRSVSFLEGSRTAQGESATGHDPLMDELFGPLEKPPPDCPWPSALLNFVQSTARRGLADEQCTGLLKQHEATGHLAVLGPPKLNKLLTLALKTAASVVKRDEHQASAQVQVAASLNAFGSAIAELLAPEVREQLPESVNPVLRRLAKGLYLLADHQYRLSLARRAFIKPSLSLMGKGVADDAPIDEWLFGTAFAEELKDAQACEKAARDLLRPAPVVTKPNPQSAKQQPAKQPGQQKKTSGKGRAPARQNTSPARRAGARSTSSRSRRSRSRSRSRRRR